MNSQHVAACQLGFLIPLCSIRIFFLLITWVGCLSKLTRWAEYTFHSKQTFILLTRFWHKRPFLSWICSSFYYSRKRHVENMDMDKCGITRCHLTCSCILSASEGICLLIMILPSSEGVTDSSELLCLQLYDVLILTFIDFNVSGLCWSPLGFTTWS